jgi:hypothetical protein
MRLGFQPVNITAQFYGSAVHPPSASPWGMRLQIALLFPKLTNEQKMGLMKKTLQEMQEEQQKKK